MYDLMGLRFNINDNNVSFYGYRKATPKIYLVSFNRDDKKISRLEDRLYEITKANKDNHVLFVVKVDDYEIALQFTDSEMNLGLGVNERSW